MLFNSLKFCPACNSDEVSLFYKIKDLPLLLFPVDKKNKNLIVQKDLTSYICHQCCHVFTDQLSRENLELIYGKYYEFYPYDGLETLNSTYRKPFELFFSKVIRTHDNLNFENLKLLEIGCSSNENLKFFNDFKLNCYGIDPSPLNKNDLNIIRGFYQDYMFNDTYDMIVARFVLEHINDLSLFLNKIMIDLNDDGIVFFQVPNILEYINNCVPLFLAHEHIQYFSPQSIVSMAKSYGFRVLALDYENRQSLCVALKKTIEPVSCCLNINIENCTKKYSEYIVNKSNLSNNFSTFLASAGSNITFYGSGMPVSWILYDFAFLSISNDGMIFDDNRLVDFRYMPNSNFIVRNYSADLAHERETILLTVNSVYYHIILDIIKSSEYRGRIYALQNNNVIKIS